MQGGSDSASARYIYTRLSPFARKLFHQSDEPLLTYNTDDDHTIEPEVYVPVVPLILINGTDGIGTGWSSSIPNYNPEDIVENLRRKMKGLKTGNQCDHGSVASKVRSLRLLLDRFKFSGKIQQTGDAEVEITELPVRVWTQDFKDKLEDIIKAEKVPSFIKDYKDYNTHKDVNFIIQMEEKYLKTALEEGLEERFKLSKTMATSNLVAFDPEGRITKYANVEAIMDRVLQLPSTEVRPAEGVASCRMQKDLKRLTNQARFIQMIIDQKLNISKKKKAILIAELKKLSFDPFPKVKDATKAGETEDVVEEDAEDSDVATDASAYDYLLGMPLWSLTQERVDRLLKQIGDKEDEVNVLMKKSKEDLWEADLEDFINEWRFQLEDEKHRQKNIRKGRRESKKFATAASRATLSRSVKVWVTTRTTTNLRFPRRRRVLPHPNPR